MDGTRAVVEQVGDRIELLLAVDRQVRALGQVLKDQPVGVLARAALPRAVRVTEAEHRTVSDVVVAQSLDDAHRLWACREGIGEMLGQIQPHAAFDIVSRL